MFPGPGNTMQFAAPPDFISMKDDGYTILNTLIYMPIIGSVMKENPAGIAQCHLVKG
jgi:hypothetical protein